MKILKTLGVAAMVVALAACSAQSNQMIPSSDQAVQSMAQRTVPRTFADARVSALSALQPSQVVENVFATAKNANLTDGEIDTFIAPSVTGTDRKLAHELLSQMPPNLRGDFAYIGKDGRVISNNPDLIPYIKLSKTAPVQDSSDTRASKAVTPMDYSSSCSPPTGSNGGAWDRQVSVCGFATGWGFLNVECGTTNLTPGQDTGYLYFEIYGSAGSAVEGGLQYNSDSSVQPYVRYASNGVNIWPGMNTVNNTSVKYTCGQTLGVFNGINLSGQTYTITGALVPGIDPEEQYVSGAEVQMTNEAWLFYPAPSDFNHPGTDPAGNSAACTSCSVSEMTAIAQAQNPGQFDGSTFGVDAYGQNAIHWMQVAFGNWGQLCVASNPSHTCPFYASRVTSVYWGGEQDYPAVCSTGATTNPLGYGVYETWNGISMASSCPSGDTHARAAAGKFGAPTPPPTPAPTPYRTPIPLPTSCVAAIKANGITPNRVIPCNPYP